MPCRLCGAEHIDYTKRCDVCGGAHDGELHRRLGDMGLWHHLKAGSPGLPAEALLRLCAECGGYIEDLEAAVRLSEYLAVHAECYSEEDAGC